MAQLKDLLVNGNSRFLSDVILGHDPTSALEAVTKQYADTFLKPTDTAGTSGTEGTSVLTLGNNIATGTAGNLTGVLELYDYYGVKNIIKPRTGTSHGGDCTFLLPTWTGSNATSLYLVGYAGSGGASQGVGSAHQPVYINSNGRAVIANIYPSYRILTSYYEQEITIDSTPVAGTLYSGQMDTQGLIQDISSALAQDRSVIIVDDAGLFVLEAGYYHTFYSTGTDTWTFVTFGSEDTPSFRANLVISPSTGNFYIIQTTESNYDPSDTSAFLRHDGTWAIPAGGGSSNVVLVNQSTSYSDALAAYNNNKTLIYLDSNGNGAPLASYGSGGHGITVLSEGFYSITFLAATIPSTDVSILVTYTGGATETITIHSNEWDSQGTATVNPTVDPYDYPITSAVEQTSGQRFVFASTAGMILTTYTLTSSNSWTAESTNLQEKLLSGTNIKTINSTSILGTGNISTKDAYSLTVNGSSLRMKSVTYRYRLLFTSADGQYFVPANNSTSTNATDSRSPCQDVIDPFGAIYFYNNTSSISANSVPYFSYLWRQYKIEFGYSFKGSSALGLTANRPIYLKCSPQSNGSAKIYNNTVPWTQTLPSSADGYIYIFLGMATSSTEMELLPYHPVYYYDGTKIALWTGGSSGGGSSDVVVIKTSDSSYGWQKSSSPPFGVLVQGALAPGKGAEIIALVETSHKTVEIVDDNLLFDWENTGKTKVYVVSQSNATAIQFWNDGALDTTPSELTISSVDSFTMNIDSLTVNGTTLWIEPGETTWLQIKSTMQYGGFVAYCSNSNELPASNPGKVFYVSQANFTGSALSVSGTFVLSSVGNVLDDNITKPGYEELKWTLSGTSASSAISLAAATHTIVPFDIADSTSY